MNLKPDATYHELKDSGRLFVFPLERRAIPTQMLSDEGIESAADAFWQMDSALDHQWPPPTHAHVASDVTFQFWGKSLNLLPDGTYNLSDTSGG